MTNEIEDAGRGTDTVMGHLSLGEVVIPRVMLDDPQVMEMLQAVFAQYETDINEFTVGHEANKINPETGYPEFFFKKLFKSKIFRTLAPIALGVLAPGLGTAIGGSLLGAGAAGSATLGGALLGAGTSALSGGGLRGALTGAALGGISPNIGRLAGGAAQGPSLPGSAAPTGYSSGILGAAGDALGASSTALSSLGGSLGNTAIGRGVSDIASGLGDTAVGRGLSDVGTRAYNALPSTEGLTSSAGGGGSSTFGGGTLGQGLSSALGGLVQDDAIDEARQAQLLAQQQQLANIGTFDPSDITNDAGYQFNLDQGQLGLDRSLAAQGGLQSGRALKAASQYNQQFADNALNSAYQRYLDTIGAQNQVYGNTGNINAQSGLASAQNLAQTASGILNPQPSIEELLRLYGRA